MMLEPKKVTKNSELVTDEIFEENLGSKIQKE